MIPMLIAVVMSLLFPRILTLILWLLTGWFHGVFHTWIWPVLGFIFVPTTLLWYSAVQNWYGGQWDPPRIGILVIAVLIDASRNGYTIHKSRPRS